MPCKQTVATMWTKGTENWVKWRGTAVAERGWIATLHLIHGAQGLESTVALGFVKHGFKVLLHRVVDGPLQASRCLVSWTLCIYTRYTRVFWAQGDHPQPSMETRQQTWTQPPDMRASCNWATLDWFVCWLLACLMSQQHASISQGRICPGNCICCHTDTEPQSKWWRTKKKKKRNNLERSICWRTKKKKKRQPWGDAIEMQSSACQLLLFFCFVLFFSSAAVPSWTGTDSKI